MTPAHSKFGPSKRHRWRQDRCPGSIREEAKFPDERNVAAIDGTHSHTLLNYCLNGKAQQAKEMIGKVMGDHDGDFTVDADRAERVDFALTYIDTRLNGGLDVKVYSELKVDPFDMTGFHDAAGTVDVAIFDGRWLEVIDYKDGNGIVAARDNDQLEQYFIGMISWLARNGTPFDGTKMNVRMTIIQPKLRARGMPGIESVEFQGMEFSRIRTRLVQDLKAAFDPEAPCVAGDEQCKYCKAKGRCPVMTNTALAATGLQMTDLNMAKEIAGKDPGGMSSEQIREIIEATPLINQMLKAVADEAMRRMQDGKDVPGLKIVAGNGMRKWANDDDLEMSKLLIKMGIPKGALFKETMLSPAQVESLTWSNRAGDIKKLTPRQIETLNSEMVVKGPGKLTVVVEADRRPAVITNVSGMLPNLEEPKTEELPTVLREMLPASLAFPTVKEIQTMVKTGSAPLPKPSTLPSFMRR